MKKRLFLIVITVLFIFALGTPSLAEFRKGPYLQNVTQNSIIVSWQTTDPTAGTVYYGIGDTNLSVADGNESTFHEVQLAGLTAGTEYTYRVEAGDDISTTNTFSTAVSRGTNFRFVAYGDNRPGDDNDTTNHEAVVALIESMTPKFVVNVGDLWKSNDSSDVQRFFDVERDLIKNVTLFSARGNHENMNLEGQTDRFAQYFNLPTNLTADDGNAYYSFDYGNSHFLFINTNIGFLEGSDQYIQIESDLRTAAANSSTKHIFVVMHAAAHSNGPHGGRENPDLSSVLGPLFVRYNVDIVFQGHDHIYERFQPEGVAGPLGNPAGDPDNITEGVTYVVTGGGGAPLPQDGVPPAPTTEAGVTPNLTSQVAEAAFEAMQIDVSGDEVHVNVFGIDGTTLDEFIIDKSPLIVGIDIRPGNRQNNINLYGKGWIEVAIRSTREFNAPVQVDKHTLTFGRTGDEQSLAFCGDARDVNWDRRKDMICYFDPQLTDFQCGDRAGILKGKLTKKSGGKSIKGADWVTLRPCRRFYPIPD